MFANYSATGYFKVGNYPNFASQWFVDSNYKLLALNAGPMAFFFNDTGFWYYDGSSCTWNTHCDFECEVYNYDTRFLDYAGTWTVTYKSGATNTTRKVEAWIGNAIDAAGIFPAIMYMDYVSKAYMGLDKLDPISSESSGTTYWYPDIVVETPNWY